MSRFLRIALIQLFLLSFGVAAQDLDSSVSAVVRITGTRNGTVVRGSGFVIGLERDKATIITASHVIEGVDHFEVTFAADRTESFPAGIVLGMETGNQRGIALFQVRGLLPAGLTTLSFDTDTQLRRGEDVFLLGFPQMATAPLILRRTFAGPYGNLLQLDLPVGEGFSGAPVLRSGKVLGVVVDEDLQITFATEALVVRAAVVGWGGNFGTATSRPYPGSSILSPSPTETIPAEPIVEKCEPRSQNTKEGIVFVRICAGTFIMGSATNDPQAEDDEKPAHKVSLSEYWISRTEITNEQYRRFRAGNKGEAGLPATNVSWDDAKAACEHFGGRLPTEAEWEYAARAGTQTAWAFGDNEKNLSEYAWYSANSADTLHSVGSKKPNTWGLQDMHGNAWEWVADRYGPYSPEVQIDPSGPLAGKLRVLRGGSFKYSASAQRSAGRDWFEPAFHVPLVGFRCARRFQP